MKSFALTIALVALGCSSNDVCNGNSCVCAVNEPCSADCVAGAGPCDVQCTPNTTCDVGCTSGQICHVECIDSTQCSVDCAGSPECHVSCPASGCTVRNCVGADCIVACGALGEGTHDGSTVTCP